MYILRKECNIGTDHQCKVENDQQWRQKGSWTREGIGEYNLVNNPVCNGIHGNEVISMQCKEISKEKGWDEYTPVYRTFPRWCARMFQRKGLRISLDKNDMMGQEKSDMRFSEGILTMFLYKNANLSMILYVALYTMNYAGMLQDRQ